MELAKKDGSRISPHLKWESLFSKLGDIGTLKGKVPTGVTASILRLLKYGSRVQLEAPTKLAGREEGFDDAALTLEARKRLQRVLEKPHKAGKVAEEEVIDGVLALGEAHNWMDERDECNECYEGAKEGIVHLLGEDSAKAVLRPGRLRVSFQRLTRRSRSTGDFGRGPRSLCQRRLSRMASQTTWGLR